MDEAVVRIKLDEGAAPGHGEPSAPRERAHVERHGDSFLRIITDLRGVLAGIFGPLAGAVLDVIAGFHRLPALASTSIATAATAAPPSSRTASPTAPAPPSPRTASPTAPVPPSPRAVLPTVLPAKLPTVLPATAGDIAAARTAAPIPDVSGYREPIVTPTKPPVSGPTAAAPAAGAAASAAPGIAIAALILKAGHDIAKALGDAARAAGSFAVSLVSASPDPSMFVDAIGKSISSFSDKLAYVNPLLGLMGGLLGGLIESTAAFMKNMDAMVDRYSAWNPALLQAQVQADMAQMMNDMRRAQQVGPSLIAYLEQRTQMQQEFEDAKVRFMQKLMPVALKGMELAEKLLPLMEIMVEGMLMVAKVLLPGIDDKLQKVKEKMEEVKGEGESWWPTDIIMKQQFPDFDAALGRARSAQGEEARLPVGGPGGG